MSATTEQIINLAGTILKRWPERTVFAKGKPFKIHDFEFQPNDSDDVLKVSKFGRFEFQNGQVIAFQATFNETYNKYTITGDIAVSSFGAGDIKPPVEPPEPEVPVEAVILPKRTAAPKVRSSRPPAVKQGPPTAVSSSAVPSMTEQPNSVTADLESVRAAAEATISKDVVFANEVLTKTGQGEYIFTANAIAVLVQALQAVRATLFIETNKRTRAY